MDNRRLLRRRRPVAGRAAGVAVLPPQGDAAGAGAGGADRCATAEARRRPGPRAQSRPARPRGMSAPTATAAEAPSEPAADEEPVARRGGRAHRRRRRAAGGGRNRPLPGRVDQPRRPARLLRPSSSTPAPTARPSTWSAGEQGAPYPFALVGADRAPLALDKALFTADDATERGVRTVTFRYRGPAGSAEKSVRLPDRRPVRRQRQGRPAARLGALARARHPQPDQGRAGATASRTAAGSTTWAASSSG